jgi:DNA-binding MarR family transcriptional regulator
MDPRRELIKETARTLEGIIQKIVITRISPQDYGTGENLFLGQIHAINAVGDHPGINITELSRILGITKGTVSPLVNKLESKKYLKKNRDAGDGKIVLLELTDKGKTAKNGFERYRNSLYSGFSKEVTFGQIAFLNEILSQLDRFLDSKIHAGD